MMPDTPPRVENNAAASRFEIGSASGLSVLKYRREGQTLDLVHTEVPAALEGKGYGVALVEAALDFARREHLTIIPTCPFVRHYVDTHPETATLLAAPRTRDTR